MIDDKEFGALLDSLSPEEKLKFMSHIDKKFNLGIINPTVKERMKSIPSDLSLANTVTFELPVFKKGTDND